MLRKKNSVSQRRARAIPDPGYACPLRKVQRLERELALARRSAYYDPLTGLPNRRWSTCQSRIDSLAGPASYTGVLAALYSAATQRAASR